MNVQSAFTAPATYAPSANRVQNAPRDPALWSACQEFEALFAQQLIRAMRGSSSFFGESTGSEIYQELYETELAKAMSKSGGIGLATILYKQMSRQMVEPMPEE